MHQADPSDAFCCYGIALEHAKAGDHHQAVQWLDKALSADSNYFYAYYQKAKSLAAVGQLQTAREILQTGMDRALGSGDQHAHEEMAQLLQTLEV